MASAMAAAPLPQLLLLLLIYSRLLVPGSASGAWTAPSPQPPAPQVHPCPTASSTPSLSNFSVVVYGGTAGGVVAAVAAARTLRALGDARPVALVNPTNALGGMVSGGLGWTDGRPSGGIAAEFFQSLGGLHVTPGAAERAFDRLVAAAGVVVFTNCTVDSVVARGGNGNGGNGIINSSSSISNNNAIEAIVTSTGGRLTAPVFVDSTYEGDLLARAGVDFAVGREPRAAYGESIAGRLPAPPQWKCAANWNLGPVNGTGPDGRLLPMVDAAAPLAPLGSGDAKVMSYNFRLCLTRNTSNKAEIPAPAAYDPARWELLRRAVAGFGGAGKGGADGDSGSASSNRNDGTAGGTGGFQLSDVFIFNKLADGKTDTNNGGGLGTDFVGGSWGWPRANYTERARMFEEHKQYTLELFHFLRTDPVVPAGVRQDMASWGLCADEFLPTGHWPHQLYVREARRMVGGWVFTMRDRVNDTAKNDSVAVGDYNIDGHATQRVLLQDGTVTNEGCLSGWAQAAGVHLGLFEIPYRVLLPKESQASNLLVSAAVSASHVGSGPLRLEPQYMNLGQAAGVAAVAVASGAAPSVQRVNVSALQHTLVQQNVTIRK